MKAHEFAKKLLNYPDLEIMTLDGFNGSGVPREINFGPIEHVVTQKEADETADCEDFVGQKVIIIGFGFY